MTTSARPGAGSFGSRGQRLPLFDRYEVDLVLSGHEHNYERSYPVRGYDRGAYGTVVAPHPDHTAGERIDTRRPHVVTTGPVTFCQLQGWDAQQGTVFVVHGCGGTNGPSNTYGTGPSTGVPRAKMITRRTGTSGSQAAGFRRYGADSAEHAFWSAATNPDAGGRLVARPA
jgi:hypothetical protein